MFPKRTARGARRITLENSIKIIQYLQDTVYVSLQISILNMWKGTKIKINKYYIIQDKWAII